MEIRPEHPSVDAVDQVKEMVMIAPVDRDVDETKHVTQEDRYRLLERAEVGGVRRLQIEHHDRDDDGDHAITEGNDPVLFHRTCFPRCLPDILTMNRHAAGSCTA